jgi:hypothetical protein
MLILTGNYAFLNWLTVAPAVMSFDDESLKRFFSKNDRMKAIQAERNYRYIKTNLCLASREVC